MEEIPKFNLIDFKILKIIGNGSSGSVMLVEEKKTHKLYATKKQFDESDRSFQTELQVYQKTKNYAVLSLLGYSSKKIISKEKFFLFMDYMKNGSVKKMLNSIKTASKINKYIILLGISLGMKYLHSEGIIHCDLKPENILLNDEMEPKICDFGQSEISDKECTEILITNKKGTPLYQAPEVFECNDSYNHKADVYSFSFVAYEIITGKSPFYEITKLTKTKLKKLVLNGKRPNISLINNDTIKDFLKKCWSQQPSNRPSFTEIVDEIKKDTFKRAFDIISQADIEKVNNYLKSFWIIKIIFYESINFENNNFVFLQHSTVPKNISDEFFRAIQKSNSFRGIHENIIHQNDPNSTYTFYFLSGMDSYLVSNIISKIFQKHNIQFMMPRWNIDIFFNEKIIQPDVLKLLLRHLKKMKNIKGVVRNIFDGRQIATYILINVFTMTNWYQELDEINASIQNLLLPRGMVFNKIQYPLERNIIMNEELILKDKNDFNLIISEIRKIGLEPINIERNRLYLYGNYFIRKLFQIFSFICFRTENEKMKALNHINSIVYSTEKNVLRYKMDLHYAKIDDSAYPKNVRDILSQLFQTFKGFQDIQEHVLSIENPVVRTYVGFDTLNHLKKAYNLFFHYVDTLRYGNNPKIFLKKKNLIYIFVKNKISIQIDNIISYYFASDVQKECIEYYGDKFNRNYSKMIKLTFYGFDGQDNLDKAIDLLQNHSIQYIRYHSIKTFINKISNVPEEYFFYDSL